MSKAKQATSVVEWTPGRVVVLNRKSLSSQRGTSISSVASSTDKSSVVLALSRTVCFLKPATLPDAPKPALEKIVRNTIAKEFPLPPGQAAIDFYITNDKGPNGRLVLIFAVSSQHLVAARKEASEAGLNIISIQPSALGTQFLAMKDQVKEGVIFSPGVDGISIDVVKEGHVHYSRVVRSDADLDVEKLRTLAAANLSEEVELYPSYSCGGVANEMIQLSSTPLHALLHEDFIHSTIHMELPAEKEEKERVAKRNAIRNSSVAFALAMLFAAYVGMHIVKSRAQVAASISQIKTKISALKTQEDKIVARQGNLEGPYSVVHRGFDPAQRMSDMLESLGADVPPGLWLTSITIQRGENLVLRGTAKDSQAVNTFVQQLSADQRFRDVKLSFANTSQEGQISVTQFSLTAFPIGNLPLYDKKGVNS